MSLLALVLTLAAALVATSPDPCTSSVLLPAYSHNDYRNSRPLLDALLLGYRGVEVDVFLQKGDLVVGHDRSELRRERTFEHLFFRQSAAVLNAPVRLTLVGWWPRPMTGPDYLSVQLAMDGRATEPAGGPTSAIGLVSVDYSKALKWSGKGNVPASATASLAAARDMAEALGVPLRVLHQAPPERSIYQWLLASGVRLIGVKDLAKGRELLATFEETSLDRSKAPRSDALPRASRVAR